MQRLKQMKIQVIFKNFISAFDNVYEKILISVYCVYRNYSNTYSRGENISLVLTESVLKSVFTHLATTSHSFVHKESKLLNLGDEKIPSDSNMHLVRPLVLIAEWPAKSDKNLLLTICMRFPSFDRIPENLSKFKAIVHSSRTTDKRTYENTYYLHFCWISFFIIDSLIILVSAMLYFQFHL